MLGRVLDRFRAEYKIRKNRRWVRKAVEFVPSKIMGWLKAVRASFNLKWHKPPVTEDSGRPLLSFPYGGIESFAARVEAYETPPLDRTFLDWWAWPGKEPYYSMGRRRFGFGPNGSAVRGAFDLPLAIVPERPLSSLSEPIAEREDDPHRERDIRKYVDENRARVEEFVEGSSRSGVLVKKKKKKVRKETYSNFIYKSLRSVLPDTG